MTRSPAYWWLPWWRRPGLFWRAAAVIERLLVVALVLVFCLAAWAVFIHYVASLWP